MDEYKEICALLEEMGSRSFYLTRGQDWECGPSNAILSYHGLTPEGAIRGALAMKDEDFRPLGEKS